MALAAGTRVGSYEITGIIGAGGMGEVYRARDARLHREVALKVLPDSFAHQPDRLVRFRREAQLLASLNHPNIAAIHGFEENDGLHALVLELVDGPTLADRIRQGPLPVDEALGVARQIAEALEAAHDRGVIHRDLKPSNISLRGDGIVKVLDFGLAKALEDDPLTGLDVSHSPTLSVAATAAGVLLGTAAYMSPEQARGKPVDKRADIWAFGCVLYEMLTGRRAFDAKDVSDIIADILRVEPDWRALPADTPPAVKRVLRRCLQKDPKERLRDIADARLELQDARPGEDPTSGAVSSGSALQTRLAWTAALIAAAVAGGLLLRATYFTSAPPAAPTARFTLALPGDANLGPAPADPFPAISPDGRYVVFRAGNQGAFRLFLRPIGALSAQPIPGTEGAQLYPFWSPNSDYIAFIAGGKLKKVAVAGGPPQVLTDTGGPANGTWNRDDVILLNVGGTIRRLSAAGGATTVVRAPDRAKNETSFQWPAFLPDGRHFVFAATFTDPGRSEFRVGALDNAADTPLFPGSSRILYAAPNHLMFWRDGSVMAQPFNPDTLTLTGSAFPVAETVGANNFAGPGGAVGFNVEAFDVSANGTLVYRVGTSGATNELTWFDRTGKKTVVAAAEGQLVRPVLSPDQEHAVVDRVDTGDMWMLDLARGTSSRFTFDPGSDGFATFSPDGSRVAFGSQRGGAFGLYVKPSSGVGAEQLVRAFPGATNVGAAEWTHDGKLILANVVTADVAYDVLAVPLAANEKVFPLLSGKYNEYRSRLSPDGRWMLYTSDETGRPEVYVQTFPPSGGKWQVSVNGGQYGYWTRGGREIVFDSPDLKVMAVDVTLGATFQAGIPHMLFQLPSGIVGGRFAATSDGNRFLVPLPAQNRSESVLRVVMNWASELRARPAP